MGLFNFKEKRLQKILDSEQEIEYDFSSAPDAIKKFRESKTRLLTLIKKEYPENSFLEFGKELPSLAMSFLDQLLFFQEHLQDYGEYTDEGKYYKLEQLRIYLRSLCNMEYDDVLKSDLEELIVQGGYREDLYHAPTIARIGVITMAKLELTENDTIEIFSKEGYRTVAKARADLFSEEHTGFILIHDIQQFNAQVREGDTVLIRKIKKIKADKIILVPLTSLADFPDSLSLLKNYGLEEPVFMKGDRIIVPVSPGRSSPWMAFHVLITVPKPSTDEITAFYFTDETEFHIAEIQKMSEEEERMFEEDKRISELHEISKKNILIQKLIQKLMELKPELSREFIDEQIRIKKEKIGGGYLTDEGAIFLIAADYGINLEKPT